MKQEEISKFGIVDPETGQEYALDVTGELFQDGENWNVKFSATTTKTQFLLFELARFVATKDNPENEAVKDGRRILQTVYKKLEFFTVEEKEDKTGILCQWKARADFRGADVDREMTEIMELPVFKLVLKHVFGITKKPDEIQTSKGGGGVRVAAAWVKARGGQKKAGKRKIAAEEMKLEFCLLKLLRDYSTHRDRAHDLYLLGNGGEEWADVNAVVSSENGAGDPFKEKLRVAVFECPQAEIYKYYTGKQSAEISTPERKRVNALLETMGGDSETVILKQDLGNKRVKWLEMTRPKITVDKGAILTESEAAEREAGGELPEAKTTLRITLHPAFTHEIGRKYSLFPDDYLERMKKATGGGRSGEKYWLLNDYLNGIRGTGQKETEANFDTLIEKMDLTRFAKKQGKGKAIAEITAAADVAKKVGLITSFEAANGKGGQVKFLFKFNPDFGGAIPDKYRTIGGK